MIIVMLTVIKYIYFSIQFDTVTLAAGESWAGDMALKPSDLEATADEEPAAEE